MIDHHVHTTFSFDGKQTLQAACQAAMEAGLTGLVITDHVDTGISWKGSDFSIADPAAYRAAIEQAKADFPRLSLLRGMELGYTPSGKKQALAYYEAIEPEVMLGSVHVVQGIDPYEQRYFELHGREKGYRLYLEQLLEGLEWMHDRIQVVSHLDYVTKFAPYPDSELHYEDYPREVDDLLRLTIGYDLCLEVNTSTLAKRGTPLPGPSILKRYHDLGGRRLTLGSDAHNSDRLGEGFAQMAGLLRQLGFTSLIQFTQEGEQQLAL